MRPGMTREQTDRQHLGRAVSHLMDSANELLSILIKCDWAEDHARTCYDLAQKLSFVAANYQTTPHLDDVSDLDPFTDYQSCERCKQPVPVMETQYGYCRPCFLMFRDDDPPSLSSDELMSDQERRQIPGKD